MNQPYLHIYALPFGLSTHSSHHRALSRAPCAIQYVLIACDGSVVSDSLWSHGLGPARFLCYWNSPGKNTGVGCHFLVQGIFLTQGWNMSLMSPALTGGFFTTTPPGKPMFSLIIYFVHCINSVYISIPVFQFLPTSPPTHFPLDSHIFVLYICVSTYALQVISCTPFSRFHIYALIYDILCASDLPWVTLSSTCRWLWYPWDTLSMTPHFTFVSALGTELHRSWRVCFSSIFPINLIFIIQYKIFQEQAHWATVKCLYFS